MADSIVARDTLKVAGSISAYKDWAPVKQTAEGTAKQVYPGITTLSPCPIPSAFRMAYRPTRPRQKVKASLPAIRSGGRDSHSSRRFWSEFAGAAPSAEFSVGRPGGDNFVCAPS